MAGFSKFEQVGTFDEFKDVSEFVYEGHLISLNMEVLK